MAHKKALKNAFVNTFFLPQNRIDFPFGSNLKETVSSIFSRYLKNFDLKLKRWLSNTLIILFRISDGTYFYFFSTEKKGFLEHLFSSFRKNFLFSIRQMIYNLENFPLFIPLGDQFNRNHREMLFQNNISPLLEKISYFQSVR